VVFETRFDIRWVCFRSFVLSSRRDGRYVGVLKKFSSVVEGSVIEGQMDPAVVGKFKMTPLESSMASDLKKAAEINDDVSGSVRIGSVPAVLVLFLSIAILLRPIIVSVSRSNSSSSSGRRGREELNYLVAVLPTRTEPRASFVRLVCPVSGSHARRKRFAVETAAARRRRSTSSPSTPRRRWRETGCSCGRTPGPCSGCASART